MATKAERTLEKHGKKVVSIRDKIKEFEKMLREEEEREQSAKNLALVELVRNMKLSYDEVKEAINLINSQSVIPENPNNNPPAETINPTPATQAEEPPFMKRRISTHDEEID